MAITISDTEPRVQYTATSGQTSFSVPFEFFTVNDIKVYNGTSLLSYNASPSSASQYSVTGAGVSGGGSITLGGGATLNDIITISRDLAIARSTDFPTSGAFQIDSLNTELDKIIAMCQQLERDLKFSPRAAATTSNTFGLTFPNLVANKILTVNSGGTALELTHDITNVNAVAAIASDITTVSGIASNVTAVAGAVTNINTVATNISSVNAVAADIAKVIAVANDLAETVSEIETVADDLNETTSEIDVVAGAIANVNAVGNDITNVNAVAGKATEIGLLGTSAVITDMGLLGTSAVITDMDILGTSANVTAMGHLGTSANVTAMGHLGTSSNVTNMSNLGTSTNVSNMATLAGITNLTNLANAHAAVSTVSSNLSAVQNFADVYRIASSAPTSSLNVGDLYFDTTANELKVYKSSGWAAAGSTVNGTSQRYTYNISGTPTTVTGADANGNTLAYDAGYADVYLNGIRMSGADITITSGTSVVFSSALANGDVVDVVAYGTFNVATVSGSAISSGTINNARLPSTISQTNIIAAGDGSSADGFITLNCSQNSHGVKIKSPAHSAAQTYTWILPTSNGSSGQVLSTNGSNTNQLSWVDAVETKPTVANVSQTIAPATATTINITGTNFSNIPQVEFINSSTGAMTLANTVSLTNATTLSVNCTLASGTYFVRIELDDGNAGRSANAIITASAAPTWSTSAGSLGTFAGNFSGTLVTLSGSSDSTVSYTETTSNLSGAGVTLNSSTGALETTDFGGTSTTATQYNFTVRLQDAEGQYADRSFSITSSFGATGGGQFN